MMFAADTHVHLYPVFDVPRLLRAAVGHWLSAARPAGHALSAGILCLTEGDDAGAFERLRAAAGRPGAGPADIRATGEENSLLAAGLELPVFLVRGQQAVCREGLEVLALGVAFPSPRGEVPLGETVERIAAAGGLAVIPWGAGKWWGRRGAVLRDYLDRTDRPEVFLGDNGGRPWFWARPARFRQARALDLPVVPGSDPLPFPGEEASAGRCSLLVREPLDPGRPAESLLRGLRARAFSVLAPAGAETAARFVAHQVRMQGRRRPPR